MLNSGKKFALCATKKINILTLVLSEIKFLNETKNHTPPPPPPLSIKSTYCNMTCCFGFFENLKSTLP